MALKKCKDCGREVSKKAKACPNCGAVRKRSIFGRLIKYSLIGLVALGVLGVVLESNKVSNMTPEEKSAYDASNEQRKKEKEAERIAKAAEKTKADEAAEKAKADEEARIAAEAEAAEVARLKAETVAREQAELNKVVDEFKAKNEAPWVRTTGTVTGDYTVDVAIETNIPFDYQTGISIGLAGLSGDDFAIGINLIRLPIENGRAELTVDVRDHWRDRLSFPSGTYELDSYFYPKWKENRVSAELLDITERVGTGSLIELVGSGESADAIQIHKARSSWVMLNVGTGEPLTDTIFSNLPDLTVIGKEKRNASVDFVHWYTPSADITIIVNNFTKEIVTWKPGKEF